MRRTVSAAGPLLVMREAVRPACASWRRKCEREPERYERWSSVIHEWQRGQCALCSSPDRLVLDHSHKTGLIRGWLCSACNTAYADWNHYWTGGTNPAAILGVAEIYISAYGNTPVVDRSHDGEYADFWCYALVNRVIDDATGVLVQFSDLELERARAYLWRIEGWPLPLEWRTPSASPAREGPTPKQSS